MVLLALFITMNEANYCVLILLNSSLKLMNTMIWAMYLVNTMPVDIALFIATTLKIMFYRALWIRKDLINARATATML